MLIGDKAKFAAEVGPYVNNTLRQVDLWACGRFLTVEDNLAYVSQFVTSIGYTLGHLKEPAELSLPFPTLSPRENHVMLLEGERDRFPYGFPEWGPTTDNILGHLFSEGDFVSFTFEFCRDEHPNPAEIGEVYIATLQHAELVQTLKGLVAATSSANC